MPQYGRDQAVPQGQGPYPAGDSPYQAGPAPYVDYSKQGGNTGQEMGLSRSSAKSNIISGYVPPAYPPPAKTNYNY